MEPETAIERQTMSIEEAARLLGIGRNNAYLAARNGEIPIIKNRKAYFGAERGTQADAGRLTLVDAFVKRAFTAMNRSRKRFSVAHKDFAPIGAGKRTGKWPP
jgi:excisionase family DNA binding protein